MQQCCNNVEVKKHRKHDFKNNKATISVYDVLKLVLLKQVVKEVKGKDIILL